LSEPMEHRACRGVHQPSEAHQARHVRATRLRSSPQPHARRRIGPVPTEKTIQPPCAQNFKEPKRLFELLRDWEVRALKRTEESFTRSLPPRREAAANCRSGCRR
jgi:hypothetical protein